MLTGTKQAQTVTLKQGNNDRIEKPGISTRRKQYQKEQYHSGGSAICR
jgi:hypothetical protein